VNQSGDFTQTAFVRVGAIARERCIRAAD